MDYNINFPNLHIRFEHVLKEIQIGNVSFACYGLIILGAILIGLFVTRFLARKLGQDLDDYFELWFLAIICSVIGARLFYVIFRWEQYENDIKSIFAIREGGFVLYGGIIAAIITTFFFTKVKDLSFGKMSDTAVIGLILGQAVGRWGDFFNREGLGEYTDNLFAMQLPVSAVGYSNITEETWKHLEIIDGVAYIQVHPTFFYEFVFDLCVFLILFLYFRHKKFDGEVFLMYLGMYGIGRFIIESLRTDALLIPKLGYPVSKAIAIITVLVAIVVIIVKRVRVMKDEKIKRTTQQN